MEREPGSEKKKRSNESIKTEKGKREEKVYLTTTILHFCMSQNSFSRRYILLQVVPPIIPVLTVVATRPGTSTKLKPFYPQGWNREEHRNLLSIVGL